MGSTGGLASPRIPRTVRESAWRKAGIRSCSMASPAAMGWPPKRSSNSWWAAMACVMLQSATERAEPRPGPPAGVVMSTAGRLNCSARRPATMPMTPPGQLG